MQIHKTYRWLAGMCAGLLTLSACTMPGETQEEGAASPQEAQAAQQASTMLNETQVLRVWMGVSGMVNGETWLVDTEGNTVNEEDVFTVLYDVITGEPQCQVRTRAELAGRDENGSPISYNMSALYDMEGNLLHDWAWVNYKQGFGNYVIRYNSDWSVFNDPAATDPEMALLWDYTTGEPLVKGVMEVQALDNNRVLALDPTYRPLGILEQDGTTYSGFPVPGEWYNANVWKNYVFADTQNPYDPYEEGEETFDTMGMLNEQFEVLIQRDSISALYYGLRGDYILYTDGGEQGIMNEEGQILFRTEGGESIQYFDGEVALLCEDIDDDTQTYWLSDLEGNVLADGFYTLSEALPSGAEERAEQFIGCRGNALELIDRTGAVVASVELEPPVENDDYIYIETLDKGLYAFHRDVHEQSQVSLLGPALETLVPAGEYSSIYRPSYYDGKESSVKLDVLQAYKSTDSEGFSALLDLQGNVLVSGLNEIYDVEQDRLTCRKGFTYGLMDWQGNWIVQRSMFDTLLVD